MRRNKGITLIALVVTIVVLLILASITIGTLTGENSAITKSQEAKKNQEISQEREIVEISATQASERDKFGEIKEENLREELTNNVGEEKYTLKEDKEKFTIVFTDSISKTEHYVWKDVPILTNANVTFKYNPSTWTNGNVTATVSTTVEGYSIQTSQDNKTWKKTNQQIFSKNGTIYVRLINTNGQYSRTLTGNVTNIDKTKPIITSVTATTNSIKLTATDEASGIIGYTVTTSNTTPNSFTSCTNTKTLNVTVGNKTQNTTYYVWVKDQAGNISVAKTVKTQKVPDLTTANVSFTYSPSGWTNGNVITTATTIETGYIVETSTDNKAWTATNKQTRSDNGPVYARLKDNTGQIGGVATGNVTNIDKIKPNILEIASLEENITITVTDEASGIIGYAITTENSQPNSYIPCNNTKKLVKKIENLSKDTQYYIWIKDEAGNVTGIEAKTIVIKTGDYVIYEPGNREYTVSSTLTGSETDQIFNTKTATNKWQVLYNDTTYGLQITSSKPVINLKLNRAWTENGFNHNSALRYSRTAYNNAITVINTVSSYYANGENAISARSIGSDPKNPTDRVTSYIVTATRHNKVSQPGVKIGDEYYLTDYNAMKNATSQNSAGIVNIGSEYYLASRGVRSENEEILTVNVKPGFTEDEDYRVRTITETGKLYGVPILANTTGAGTDYFGWHMTSNAGIRPVVKLKDGLKVVSGAGTNENPYILK